MVVHFFGLEESHLFGIIHSFVCLDFPQKFVLCGFRSCKFDSLENEKNKIEEFFRTKGVVNFEFVYDEKDFINLLIEEASIKENICVLHGVFKIYNSVYKIWKLFLHNKALSRIVNVWWNFSPIEYNGYKNKFYKLIKSFILSRLKYNIVLAKDEKKWLEECYSLNNVFVAPYMGSGRKVRRDGSIFYFYKSKDIDNDKELKRRVLVSHNGFIGNNHKMILDLLKKRFDNVIQEVSLPLCYGPKNYIDDIIQYGISLFGDRFTFFVNLKPIEEYIEYIRQYDIYITAAEFQSGFGALMFCLGNGLKVYAKGVNYNEYLTEGFFINKIEDLNIISEEEFKKPLDKECIDKNILILSEEKHKKAKKNWEILLS